MFRYISAIVSKNHINTETCPNKIRLLDHVKFCSKGKCLIILNTLDPIKREHHCAHKFVNSLEAKLIEPPKMLPGKLKFLRNTSYFGQMAKSDRQGRVLIPTHLREAAAVEGMEVDVIGQLNYLEVWNRSRFNKILESDP